MWARILVDGLRSCAEAGRADPARLPGEAGSRGLGYVQHLSIQRSTITDRAMLSMAACEALLRLEQLPEQLLRYC